MAQSIESITQQQFGIRGAAFDLHQDAALHPCGNGNHCDQGKGRLLEVARHGESAASRALRHSCRRAKGEALFEL